METQLNLTRREYFAALAMQGLMANSSSEASVKEIAEIAVTAADEMIDALDWKSES